MNITKFGQSCLLIEEQGEGGMVRMIMDPGSFSTAQNELEDISIVFITHDHMDHFAMDSVKEILAKNPEAKIFTTAAVQELLQKEGIASTAVAHGEMISEKGISIEGVGEKHAILLNSMPQSDNVGFIIADKLFYPGDALTEPMKPIKILALPAAAPWAKISEIVDYLQAVKPKIAFPVHDSILAQPEMMAHWLTPIAKSAGIEYVQVELNKEYSF